MEQVWRSLREQDIQGLPPGMRRLTRWISNLVLRQFIGVTLPKVPSELSTSPPPQESWLPLPLRPKWLAERLVGRWNNLLDTGPLKDTLQNRMGLDPEIITQSSKTLLITATNVRTGERTMFSNRLLTNRRSGKTRRDVVPGITIQRILASCSIPLVYPWTFDDQTAEVYWDGAVVANTPLGGALDAAQAWPVENPMETVVVLMTPFTDYGKDQSDDLPVTHDLPLPQSFNEAITFTLDWALLATFRERLRLTEAFNQLARMEREMEETSRKYREVNVIIVAPNSFFPVARIIDYDERTDQLIQLGYEAAERAFLREFPDPPPEG